MKSKPLRRALAIVAAFCASEGSAAEHASPVAWIPGHSSAAAASNPVISDLVNDPVRLGAQVLALRAIAERAPPELDTAIAQFLATFESIAGNYERAADANPFRGRCELASVENEGAFHAEEAAAAIIRHLDGRRVLIINESHARPVTRVLPFRLLTRLRSAGFTHLAIEALSTQRVTPNCTTFESVCDTTQRGYPLDDVSVGIYTREPVFAELIRNALRLRFTLVAYDDYDASTSAERDAGQAHRLNHILQSDPGSRIVALVGFDHALESQGRMASRLKEFSGLDPLTIDQVDCLDVEWNARDAAHAPVVLQNAEGRVWSAREGEYDATVVTPSSYSAMKSDWLLLAGARFPVPVPTRWCEERARLVEAISTEESARAVPADRFIALPGRACRPLFLKPGRYTLRLDGRTEIRALIVSGNPLR